MDEFLDAEKQLAEIKSRQVQNAKDYADVKAHIFNLMDKMVGEDKPVKFTSERTGMIIGRELHPSEPTPLIDSEALSQLLPPELWDSITDTIQILNQEKLAQAVDSGQIPQFVIDQVASYKQPEHHLIYRKAPKISSIL